MKRLLAAVAVACVVCAAPARAGSVLDRVRAAHVVRCGATERPGLASDEAATGLLRELCRGIATAVLGPEAPVAFSIYDSDASFDAVRTGTDDVFFLDASEVVEQHLAGKVLPGPTAYIESISVIVKAASAARHVADLAGQPICFLLGDNAQRSLEAWFVARNLSFVHVGHQEQGEMEDAFESGMCQGLAAETTALAELQSGTEGRPQRARLLPEAVTAFPILAMTGTADAQWSAIVAWTIDTLIAADAKQQPWSAGGVDALPLEAPELGLAAGWQRGVLDAVGSYGAIYRRTLGDASPYHLAPGLNAAWSDGLQSGLMLAPHAE